MGRALNNNTSTKSAFLMSSLQSGCLELMRKRSEEHTSELQSHLNLVCRLLLEKKNNTRSFPASTATGCREFFIACIRFHPKIAYLNLIPFSKLKPLFQPTIHHVAYPSFCPHPR